MPLNGILNVDKPAGWTSFDVVGFVRRRCGVKRVGHAGTLDPAATGVLPVLIGQAARLTEYLMDSTKAYEAVVELGVETDTYDREGEVVASQGASTVTLEAIAAALGGFRGEFLQMPPVYSALKRDGVPLYKRARRGESVEVEPRAVRVLELNITAWEPPFVTLHVECAKGFYVRSLAHDLGQALGVGGTLAGLRRSRVGGFSADAAVDIEALRESFEHGNWETYLYSADEVLLHWDAAILNADGAVRLGNGQGVGLELQAERTGDGLLRAYSSGGEFLGVARLDGERLVPEKMFSAS